MPVRAVPAKIIRPGKVETQPVEVILQDIRHPILLGNSKVSGKLLIVNWVARPKTDMMMVTRPWSMPVTKGMGSRSPRVPLDLGWGSGTCRHVMPATISTESIYRKYFKSKARQAQVALGPGL